jgi:predicted ribosome quality control (RQC) complex YloA/Tae2 family protein
MNDAEIENVTQELKSWVGTPFSTLWQPARDRVLLGLGTGRMILIVPRGPFARLHAVDERPQNPPKPFSFQGACRAHLHGPLREVARMAGERIVRLTFGRGALEARLTGSSGGLWLLEGERVVAALDGPAPPALPPVPVRGPHAASAPRFQPGPGQSWNEASALVFGTQETERDVAERRARVTSALHRALSRGARLVQNLHADLARADEAPAVRHRADLLAANLHRVRRGDRAVLVDDWDSQSSVWIDLDPTSAPSANLDRAYHLAKRLDRTADQVLARLEQVEAEQRWMEEGLASIGQLGRDALISVEGRLPKASSAPRRPRDVDRPAPGHVTWRGPNGERVLVGRSARGNRILTFQVAKGQDWWMHLRDRPGAHLILPTPKGASPPLPILLIAAQLALLAGRIGVGEAAEVQYTRVRDVRAIPGEEGRVTIRDEKVLRVVRDPLALIGWAPVEPP